MVERLKIAVEKARADRAKTHRALGGHRKIFSSQMGGKSGPANDATTLWDELEQVELDPNHLERNRIVAHGKTDPAHVAFDVLRTQILRVFQKHGWTRLGITSPTDNCGKTFVAANLALSLSRQPDCHTVLMDMDLRRPSLARTLGVPRLEPANWFLKGDIAAEEYMRLVGHNLALGLNSKRVRDAAELIQSPTAARTLDRLQADLNPDIVVYDLPPMLPFDDVLGFLPQLDCVLLIVGGGRTRASEVTECERLLAEQTHLLGVLLNQAEGAKVDQYGGYDSARGTGYPVTN